MLAPIFLRALRSKDLKEGWYIAPMHQIPLGRQTLRREGGGGVATYAQQWKTSDIFKNKPAGRLYVEIIIRTVGPHHFQVRIGLVLIHQCNQQIKR